MTLDQEMMKNPHLDGSPFFWKGNDTAILCLHGFTATTVEVRKIAEFLHHQGYTVSAPLLPGHGTDPQELIRTRWMDWYLEAEKSYHELAQHYSRVFVLGESMGALLTLHLAANYPSICGIMVFAPAIRIKYLWFSKILWPFKQYLWKGKPNPEIPQQSYKVYPLKAASSLYDLQKMIKKEFNQIQTPILVFQGKLDRTIDPLGAVDVFEKIGAQDKEFIFLESSEHIILLDKDLPTVQQICADFLQARAC